jgi:hypothetical protein
VRRMSCTFISHLTSFSKTTGDSCVCPRRIAGRIRFYATRSC